MPDSVPAARGGTWLLAADPADPFAGGLATALRERGHDVAFAATPFPPPTRGTAGLVMFGCDGDEAALAQIGRDHPVWLVTREAVTAAPGDRTGPPRPGAGPVRVRGGRLDLPAAPDARVWARTAAVLTAPEPPAEDLAVRAAGLYAQRMRPTADTTDAAQPGGGPPVTCSSPAAPPASAGRSRRGWRAPGCGSR